MTRFLDLGVQPFQVSTSVLGIMATRLVRKLCTNCREQYDPLDGELKLMNMSRADIAGKKIYRAGDGCEECHGIGYNGRMGIHELMILDDEIRETLMASQDSNKIKKKCIERGMKTLRDSAMQKVVAGLTSLEEAIANTQTDDLGHM